MEFVLTQTGAGADAEPHWTTKSRGTETTRSQHLCATVTDLIADSGFGQGFAELHRPTMLEPELLDGQDLIVTASKEERSIVARLRPQLRSRTFTVKEAVRLGRAPLTEAEIRRAGSLAPQSTGLALYAAVLHERRGMVNLGRARRPVLPWTAAVDPIDVPDVHDASRRVHVRALKEAEGAARELRAQLSRFLRGPGLTLRRDH
jgi:protein-tyrosine phosphatase